MNLTRSSRRWTEERKLKLFYCLLCWLFLFQFLLIFLFLEIRFLQISAMIVGQVFLGSFLGAIIGGGCTCWAVIMQKQYADEQREIDDIASIRPYIVAIKPSPVTAGGIKSLYFEIQNIGLNSACVIEIYAINENWEISRKNIEQGKYCLTVNSKQSVKPNFNFAETSVFEFHYMDLKSNLYHQEFRYDEKTNSFISLEPKNMGKLRTEV